MQKSVMWSLVVIFCLALPSVQAIAQEFPKYEFGGGFSYYTVGHGSEWYGWNTWGAKNLNRWFGLAYDIAGLNSSEYLEYSYFLHRMQYRRSSLLAGIRVANRNLGRTVPYFHVLMGVAHTKNVSDLIQIDGTKLATASSRANAFALVFGGGIQCKIKDPLAIRLFHIDYMQVRTPGGWEEGIRLSVGLAVRLGKAGY